MGTGISGLDRGIEKTNQWLNDVCAAFDTEDRAFGYRVLRAWLHVVRDMQPVDDAAHLAAQLPELLRGVYYEGWRPAIAPIRRSRDLVVAEFASAAHVSRLEVPRILPALTTVAAGHLSPGTLDHALSHANDGVQQLLHGAHAAPSGP